jgi:hypothetical protein
MRALTGDESINAFFGGLDDLSTRSASHQANSPADCRPTGGKVHFSGNGSLEIFSEQVAFDLQVNLKPDLEKAAPRLWKAECVAEQGIISVAGMSVQRKVSTVDCEVVRDRQLQLAIERPSKTLQASPKEPVMHDEEIRPAGDSHLEDGLACIHRHGNLRDSSGVLQLQAVERIRVVVKFRDVQQIVLIADDFL